MSDSYQAVYDAVRSRITGANVGDVIADIARQSFDISMSIAILTQEFSIAAERQIQAAEEAMRPSSVFRPKLFLDGDQWCALYGENIQEGVAGFGKSPNDAMLEFDRNWATKLGVKGQNSHE